MLLTNPFLWYSFLLDQHKSQTNFPVYKRFPYISSYPGFLLLHFSGPFQQSEKSFASSQVVGYQGVWRLEISFELVCIIQRVVWGQDVGFQMIPRSHDPTIPCMESSVLCHIIQDGFQNRNAPSFHSISCATINFHVVFVQPSTNLLLSAVTGNAVCGTWAFTPDCAWLSWWEFVQLISFYVVFTSLPLIISK